VACHSLEQIGKAELIGADKVMLSPVRHTESHPEATPLGWKNFSLMARQTALPIFALGAMNRQLLSCAQENGAYGVAGIRSFWAA
jgi:thiamine monophosphate synthase